MFTANEKPFRIAQKTVPPKTSPSISWRHQNPNYSLPSISVSMSQPKEEEGKDTYKKMCDQKDKKMFENVDVFCQDLVNFCSSRQYNKKTQSFADLEGTEEELHRFHRKLKILPITAS